VGLDVLSGIMGWPSEDARQWVGYFARIACADENTAALVLIGSLARNAGAPADVDLLYIYHNHPIAYRQHPIDVDIRAYSADDIPGQLSRAQDLLSWSVRFGRLVCEHDRYWTTLTHAWCKNMPLPNPQGAEERAQRAATIYEQLRKIGDQDAAAEQLLTLLTHKAWAKLLHSRVHPASRPELPKQLRAIDEISLASELDSALKQRAETIQPFVVAGGSR
jgi:hypothetical protein